MNIIWKKILILSPIVILITMLYLVNYAVTVLHEIKYSLIENSVNSAEMIDETILAFSGAMNRIIIPVAIIGILLIIVVQYAIWLRATCEVRKGRK